MSRDGFAKRAVRFLRSPRLAIALLLLLVVLAFVGTLVPQLSRGATDVATWARAHPSLEAIAGPLGLHSLYSSPAFLLLVLLLAASTTACAWHRTSVSVRSWREPAVPQSVVRRLKERPAESYTVADDTDDAAALDAARDALRGIGLRAELEEGLVRGEAGRIGLLGSPIFHWTLVALILVVGLGRLTRWEGLVGVPVGQQVPESAKSFSGLGVGALSGGPSGLLKIGVSDFLPDYRQGGTDRGPSPVVTLYRGGQVVASARVYANSPLRSGTLLIHQDAYGLAGVITAETSQGAVVASSTVLADFSPGAPTGMTPALVDLSTGSQGVPPKVVTIRLLADRGKGGWIQRLPQRPRATVSYPAAGGTATITVSVGEPIAIPGGVVLRLASVDYYARLSVADDWSIYPMYLLFGLAIIGLAAAVFFPRRTAWVLLVAEKQGRRLNVVTRHARRDPVFLVRVRDAMEAALSAAGTPPESSEDEG